VWQRRTSKFSREGDIHGLATISNVSRGEGVGDHGERRVHPALDPDLMVCLSFP
jgi:hypothetical protein